MGKMEGRVFYLIFERADGDVRCQMDAADSNDFVWCMRALRDSCLGLAQVHRELIAHQDMKPSNVLTFEAGKGFKITDFGRSSRRGNSVWHDELKVAGDKTYAPPELLYGHLLPDFQARRIGTDMYMLGNLAAFLFTGTNMTAEMLARMDPSHHWRNWRGSYDEVRPYVSEAFGRVIEDLRSQLPGSVREEISMIVSDLCNPDIHMRGHKKTIGKAGQYSLERYVSHLTNFTKNVEVRARAESAAK